MYLSGEGVEQNYIEAIEYYRKAAMQGNNTAQCKLNEMYKKNIVTIDAIIGGVIN